MVKFGAIPVGVEPVSPVGDRDDGAVNCTFGTAIPVAAELTYKWGEMPIA